MSIKMKHSSLPNQSVQIATGGNKSIMLTPVVVPRKETTDVLTEHYVNVQNRVKTLYK